MPRFEAYINADWRECGKGFLVVARFRESRPVEWAALLLDCWCLGVKDAVFEEAFSEGEFRDVLQDHLPADRREPIHPACAKKLVEGAVDYARQFGFAPHRDYRKARRIFNGVDADACPDTFAYGKDGRPLFIASDEDKPERIDRVLAMLEARCGPGGYDYVGPSEEDLEEEDPLVVRQVLFECLEDQPGHVARFYEFSGLLTAILLCPEVIMPAKFLEEVWGPGGRTWENEDEAKEFYAALMDYWNILNSMILNCVAADHHADEHPVDVWEDDFERREDYLTALNDWTRGFERAIQAWPQAWNEAVKRPDMARD